jgi:hypothetical protein
VAETGRRRQAEALLRHAENLRDQADVLVAAGKQLLAEAIDAEEFAGTVTPIRPDDNQPDL